MRLGAVLTSSARSASSRTRRSSRWRRRSSRDGRRRRSRSNPSRSWLPRSCAPRSVLPRSALPRSAVLPRSVLPRSVLPRSVLPRSVLPGRCRGRVAAVRRCLGRVAAVLVSPLAVRAVAAVPRSGGTLGVVGGGLRGGGLGCRRLLCTRWRGFVVGGLRGAPGTSGLPSPPPLEPAATIASIRPALRSFWAPSTPIVWAICCSSGSSFPPRVSRSIVVSIRWRPLLRARYGAFANRRGNVPSRDRSSGASRVS